METKKIHKVISFFKDCYLSDNRETNVSNVFSRKINLLLHINKERVDFINENSKFYFINSELEQITPFKRYKREKSFIYAPLFILCNVKNENGKSNKISAPIFYYNGEIDNNKFIIKKNEFTWNLSVLRRILNSETNLDELELLDRNNVEQIINWINDNSENFQFKIELNLDFEEFSKIHKSRSLKKAFLCCQGLLLVVERSSNTRGILHELEKLEKEHYLSNSLNQLLTGNSFDLENINYPDFGNIPGVLSESQQEVLINASSKRLSQVIGPPGTGKSYTIANIAIDRFLIGEKILVVTNNEYAIDVIHKQLKTKLGISSQGVVRAGGANYHKELKKTVNNLLINFKKDNKYKHIDDSPLSNLENYEKLSQLKKKINKLEEIFNERSEKAVKHGLKIDNVSEKDNFWRLLSSFQLIYKAKKLEGKEPLFKILSQLQKLYKSRESLISEIINYTYEIAIFENLAKYESRKNIVKFQSALKARDSVRQKSMFEKTDYEQILNIFPIWLSSLEGLHKALPLNKDLFDLVIIDEATQCDIASCLPAIQRAKRVVVVGDPKQLRHVSFLSRNKQNQIKIKNGLEDSELDLNFRDESMIDMINHNLLSSEDVVMLDEHYRSLPEIINFSNKYYYNNNLRIMTEKPLFQKTNPLIIKEINGNYDKGINKEEAFAIKKYLRKIINQQKKIPKIYKLSIGLLSFFRDQSELLKEIILEFTPKEIDEHDLRAGTPYSFQGEERDIMILSCCLDSKSKHGTYTYLNKKNMFNVAVTRAKTSQIIFTSTSAQHLPKNNQLKHYLDSIQECIQPEFDNISSTDEYIVELTKVLAEREIKLLENYSIAGVLMDLVAVYKDRYIGIDLIGFPGEYEEAFKLNRYKIFDRAGFNIFPITLYEWQNKRAEIVNGLGNLLNNNIYYDDVKLSPQSLTEKWPGLLTYNLIQAKEVQLIEKELDQVENGKHSKQLELLIEAYHLFLKTLEKQLSKVEHTFDRYKNAADTVLESCINNYEKILKLNVANFSDKNENNSIVNVLFKEQEHLIKELFEKNQIVIEELQKMTINWSRVNVNSKNKNMVSLITQLKSLNEQIKRYGN